MGWALVFISMPANPELGAGKSISGSVLNKVFRR